MAQLVIETTTGPVSLVAREGETILEAGLRQGVALPYECATGTCGTCRARLIEGEVDEGWPEAPGRQNLKPARREFLMCQAAPRTDCRLALLDPLDTWRTGAARPAAHAARIARLERLTPDIMALSVALPQPMAFEAGQFMLLAAPQVPGFRAYSMADWRSSAQRLDFIVKRKPDGGFSRWLFASARPGDSLRLFGPLGSAVLEPVMGHDLLIVVGGSGLAVALSILGQAARQDYLGPRHARLFVGVRSVQDAIGLPQLSSWHERFGLALQVTLALSEVAADAAERARWPAVRFETGMVHEVVARSSAGDTANTMAFLAGPPAMVDATMRTMMLKWRLPASRIRFDKFT